MNAWQKFKKGDKVKFTARGWILFPMNRHGGKGTVVNIISPDMIRVHPQGLKSRVSMHMDFWEKDK